MTNAHSDERIVHLDEFDAIDVAYAAGVGLAFMAALPQDYRWWADDDELADLRKLLFSKLPDAPYPVEHGAIDVARALNRLVDDEIFYEFLARVDEQKEKVLAERDAREERMAARANGRQSVEAND